MAVPGGDKGKGVVSRSAPEGRMRVAMACPEVDAQKRTYSPAPKATFPTLPLEMGVPGKSGRPASARTVETYTELGMKVPVSSQATRKSCPSVATDGCLRL